MGRAVDVGTCGAFVAIRGPRAASCTIAVFGGTVLVGALGAPWLAASRLSKLALGAFGSRHPCSMIVQDHANRHGYEYFNAILGFGWLLAELTYAKPERGREKRGKRGRENSKELWGEARVCLSSSN